MVFLELKAALNAGRVRAAERGSRTAPGAPTPGSRPESCSASASAGSRPPRPAAPFPFYDKDTYPLRRVGVEDGIRIVPGGSAIRDGCYVAPGVVCMPPMYINVGA